MLCSCFMSYGHSIIILSCKKNPTTTWNVHCSKLTPKWYLIFVILGRTICPTVTKKIWLSFWETSGKTLFGLVNVLYFMLIEGMVLSVWVLFCEMGTRFISVHGWTWLDLYNRICGERLKWILESGQVNKQLLSGYFGKGFGKEEELNKFSGQTVQWITLHACRSKNIHGSLSRNPCDTLYGQKLADTP